MHERPTPAELQFCSASPRFGAGRVLSVAVRASRSSLAKVTLEVLGANEMAVQRTNNTS